MADTSFTRWQGRAIEQMGSAINTLLSLSIATLGFVLSKLIEWEGDCCSKWTIIMGCAVILVSILGFLFLIINRLLDFSLTARIARKRDTKVLNGIALDRKRSQKLGKRTWCIFYFSIGSFALGEVFIIIGFALTIL